MYFQQQKFVLLIFLALLSFEFSVIAGEIRKTPHFREVWIETQNALKKLKPEQILVVFDIDNTLLTMTSQIGSDQWYNWQAGLLKTKNLENAVGKNFDELFDAQDIIFALGQMHPPEPEIPDLVKEIQKSGVKTVILTSRGSQYRSVTEREFRRNHLDFTNSTFGPEKGYPSTYLPFDLQSGNLSGLKLDKIKELKAENVRPVSFTNGIFMGSGQHKGLMLKSLLHKTKAKFKKIIFIDDTEKNINAVFELLNTKTVDVTALYYTQMESIVKDFENGDKKLEIKAWQELQKLRDQYFK